ncbi:MAG: beta-lactamase family protein [Sphingomonadales bacterium]|nr:beta-lactamase family protein [Sphingomonadales bacterium]
MLAGAAPNAVGAQALPAPQQQHQAIEGGVPLTPENRAHVQRAAAEVLFWNQEQRDQNFPHMEKLFPGHVVRAGKKPLALPPGPPLPIAAATVDAFIKAQNVAGLIVLQQGAVRLERYARGLSREGRWTSFSVAKSFTSTLVGAAIRDGHIKSVDEPVTRYIPDLAGSAYDGVTIAQLLTMTSGVKWNEDYTDPNSDVARMFSATVPAGVDPTVAYMRTLPREAAPGSKWVYKTGETNLIGVLVGNAIKRPLANYLSEKVWKPYGMADDAFWMIDPAGHEVGGCWMEGGHGIVAPEWFEDATKPHADTGRGPGFGYGYQWWTYPEHRFGAVGVFGQSITVDRASKTVIVIVSAWPKATDSDYSKQRLAFLGELFKAAKGPLTKPPHRRR